MKGTMFLVFKLMLLLVPVTMILACHTTEKKSVSSDEFIRLYSGEWSYGDYWEYTGIKKGKHWLVHYKLPKVQTLPVVVESVWVSVKDLPNDFPQIPQQPLNKGDLKNILKKD